MEDELDLYGQAAKFKRGDTVYKTGAGYSGPGKVYAAFLGEDLHWRYVVAHKVDGGQGRFYHLYGLAQLTANPAMDTPNVTVTGHEF